MPTSDEILAQLNSGPAPSSDEILARLNSPTGDLGGETPEAREFLRRRQRELGPEAVPTGQIEERSIPIPDAGDPGISVGDVAADAAAQINQGVAFLADPAARVALGPAYYLPPVKRGLEALSRRADEQREETSRALEERAQSVGGEMAARAASFATSLAADPLNLIPGAAVLRRAGRAAGTARQGTARSDEVGRFLSKYTDTGAASEGAKGTTVLESLTGDFYQRWVSREAPLEKIAPDLVQRKRGAKAIARAPIYDYTFRFDRELGRNIPTGEPLADIVSGLSGEAVGDLRAYMLARREIELAERAAKGENLRISEQAIEDGKKVLAEIDGAGKTEVLEERHRLTVEWADKAILQPLEEVGVILPEDRAVMRGSNIDYAPMLRAAREEVDEMIHRIHGGLGDAPDEKVIDPLQALIVKAQKVQIFAENQRVRNALVEWADNNPDALDEIRGATATEALRGDSTINYWRNGEKKSFKVNKQLAQALDLHTPGSLSFTLRALESNPFWKAMKGAASALRAGATLTVDFAFRNLFRDQFGAAYSKDGYVPYEGIIRGIFKAFGKGDKYEQLWRAHGGDLSAMVSPDRPQAMATLQDITASSVPEKATKVMSK